MSDTSRVQKAMRKPEVSPTSAVVRLEDEASEGERLLRLVTDRSPVSIAYCGADRTYKFANKLYAQRFGLLPQDIVGRSIRDVFGEEAYVRLTPYIDAVLGGKRVEFERKEGTPESGFRYAWVNHEPVYDDLGQVIGYVATVLDITERKRAESELRESEAYFHGLADATPHLVWTARPDGSVEYYNSRARQYDGITSNADGSWEWQPIVHEADLRKTVEAWESAVRSGKIYECEHQLKLADGTFRWHLSRGVPMKNDAGEIIKWFGTATDVHDLRMTEQSLRENDQRKDEFLAMLAHELRNPLAPIRNAIKALKRLGRPEPHLQQLREMIENQVAHMARLLDDLLDVSRITRNKITLRKEGLELMTVVARAIEVSRPHVDAHNHRLTVSMPSNPVRIEGDLTRLAQVVSNLLNNAAKYTEDGGNIWLTAEETGDEVVLRVKDDGMGIPAYVLPHIFDIFTQADRSLDRSQGGLGIGLTLVRQLVELHGGQVEAHSEGLGKGSEFVVRLPAVTFTESKSESSTTSIGIGATPAKCFRILVVDDNEDAAESLVTLLKLDGHDVRVAYDGLTAVESARGFRPQVVLLDIGLPDVNGYDVAGKLRSQDETKDAFLIAVTGYGRTEDRVKALTGGFNYHVTKPVNPDEMDAIIRNLAFEVVSGSGR